MPTVFNPFDWPTIVSEAVGNATGQNRDAWNPVFWGSYNVTNLTDDLGLQDATVGVAEGAQGAARTAKTIGQTIRRAGELANASPGISFGVIAGVAGVAIGALLLTSRGKGGR